MVAIDLLPVEPVAGANILLLDFTDDSAPEKLKSLLRDGKADVVLSDMAAEGTGHTRTDHLRIIGLAEMAADFACDVLTPGGAFLCKVFQGGTEKELLELLKKSFHNGPPREATRQPAGFGGALRAGDWLPRALSVCANATCACRHTPVAEVLHGLTRDLRAAFR